MHTNKKNNDAIPFPLKERPRGEPFDTMRVFHHGHYDGANITKFEEGKKLQLRLYIREGKFQAFLKAQENNTTVELQRSEIEQALFEFADQLGNRALNGDYASLMQYFSIVLSYDDERNISGKIYGKLEELVKNPFLILKPDVYVALYHFLGKIPEGIISRNQGFRLKFLLEESVTESFEGSLKADKTHGYQIQMVYSTFFAFVQGVEKKLPVSSGIQGKLEQLFEEYFELDVELLIHFGVRSGDLSHFVWFFDGIHSSFREYKITHYFYQILYIAHKSSVGKNPKLTETIAGVLEKFSYPYYVVIGHLRTSLNGVGDYDNVSKLFDAKEWRKVSMKR